MTDSKSCRLFFIFHPHKITWGDYLKNSLIYKSGLAPESAGIFKVSVWEDGYALVENHNGIIDLKDECIKIYSKKRIFAVFGQKLRVLELDGCNLKIKGEIFKTEYLT